MGDLKPIKIPQESNPNSSNSPWQLSLKSKFEKWSYIFQNELYTDLTLVIGPQQQVLQCHRVILILNSPVFESMLSCRWTTTTKESELLLPEDDFPLFKILLECFYTENIGTTSVEDLISLLILSKKYICPVVTAKVVSLLKTSLTEKNAIQIYEAVRLADEQELEKTVESFILSKATMLVGLGEFSKFDKDTLSYFLRHDDLNVDEVQLFNAVYKWGEGELVRKNSESQSEENPTVVTTISSVLADILPLIRFPLMSPEDFSKNVVSRHVLPLEDTVKLYQLLTMDEAAAEEQLLQDDTFPFNTNLRRRKIFSYVFKRLKGHGFDYGRKWQNFCFQVNSDIRLVSLGMFRSVSPEVELEIGLKICDYDLATIFAQVEDKVTCPLNGAEDVFHIRFPKPVKISKNTVYTISYIIKGSETFYKCGEPKNVELLCHDGKTVSFSFQEGKADSDMDQVPEFCFQL